MLLVLTLPIIIDDLKKEIIHNASKLASKQNKKQKMKNFQKSNWNDRRDQNAIRK